MKNPPSVRLGLSRQVSRSKAYGDLVVVTDEPAASARVPTGLTLSGWWRVKRSKSRRRQMAEGSKWLSPEGLDVGGRDRDSSPGPEWVLDDGDGGWVAGRRRAAVRMGEIDCGHR
jgi:hypothetical protein